MNGIQEKKQDLFVAVNAKALIGNGGKMENEIAVSNNWDTMKDQASTLIKSGFLPKSIATPEQAIAVILTSKELGIGMMEAFRSINVIQGKPTISPQLMLALANRTKELKDIKIDASDERCVVTVIRKGRQAHTETFGVKEATALQLMGRDNYNKQRSTMFKWRALAANLRVTFPDVMLGFYTPEEMGVEVKIGENESMEVVDIQETEYDTGVRVPAGYWDLREKDAAAAQERIGKDYYPKKTPKGWFLFTKVKPDPIIPESMKTIGNAGSEPAPKELPMAPASFISHDQQLEIHKKAKERGIAPQTLKTGLKEVFGLDGTAKMTTDVYMDVIRWIEEHESAAVGQ